jgi:hypothetical protein
MRTRFARLALLVIAVLPVLAGCGGGNSSTLGDPGSTGEGAITKAELISKGDAICRRADKIRLERLHAYTKKHPESSYSVAGLETEIKQAFLPPVAAEIEELVALEVPEGDAAELEKILKGFEKAVHMAEKKPRIILQPTGPFQVPDELAARYGFKDCAQPL